MQENVVALHRAAELFAQALDRLLEAPILERDHLAALVAHEVMVVMPAGVERLVTSRAVVHVDALNQRQR